MNMFQGRSILLALAGISAGFAGATGQAAEFYKGKSLQFVIGAAAGGGYDLPGRAISRHLGRHIPGRPAMVVKNMSGASGLKMTNWLYNVARRDGSVIGMPTNNIPFEPLVRLISRDGKNIHFDTNKLQWIGSPTRETYVAFVWHAAPVKSVDDLKNRRVLMGSTSPAGTNSVLPTLTNDFLGTKMQVITGYGSQSNIFIALERGEVQGNVTGLTNLTVNKADWLREKKARILVQYGLRKDPKLPDVPFALDLVQKPEDKAALRFLVSKFQVARPLVAPPGVPADRMKILRAAFDATMKDKAFLADTGKLGLDIDPVSSSEMTALIAEVYKTPKAVIERTRRIILEGRKKTVKRAGKK
ncbi:MAG: tripartite tricarboxylate transporter substrate-binding protein [Alphaproteobacteria bacterium]|nr:tripartite tricarboxylate transporter substrate-binding protein [Alphaproteobacteria bacterium]